MARLRYLRAAKRDITEIMAFIAAETGSVSSGRRFAERLLSKCSNLSALPGHMGRPRPELGEGIRSSAFQGYLIIYRYIDDILVVVRIFEGHRDIGQHFEGEE
ncbi:type II toxin-antitoxin system RelE/ParE family toxin [Rhizobium sp. RAF56]|uniref:type II toxin-antitoxin system RelE/ParE family toxin n=1 Tax=Rhizobium sp. RAF56 TaxID=3233062 RepID=UPI003F965D68